MELTPQKAAIILELLKRVDKINFEETEVVSGVRKDLILIASNQTPTGAPLPTESTENENSKSTDK